MVMISSNSGNRIEVTSSTFFGQIYSLFGLENIADPADGDGSAFGYPQLSSEFVVAAESARFGMSLAQVGLAPTWFLTKKLMEVADETAQGIALHRRDGARLEVGERVQRARRAGGRG